MNWLLFVLWILPDLLGSSFIAGWPALYRLTISRLVTSAISRLRLANQKEESMALVSYHQDLNLVTAGAFLSLISFVKLLALVMINNRSSGDVSITLLFASLAAIIFVSMAALWVGILHGLSDELEYLNIDDTAVSPLIFWPPKNKIRGANLEGFTSKFRVAGPRARWIFWTRCVWIVLMVVFSGVSVSDAIWDIL